MANKNLPIPTPIVLDFETFAIEDRPRYPPMPCSLSVKYPGKKEDKYTFGHIEGNNTTWGEVAKVLAKVWKDAKKGDGIVCQNGKFDCDVAETWFGLESLPYDKVHDTLFLAYLDDPHQNELGLKPTAKRLLNIPDDDQEAVGDWLIENQPVPGAKISKSKQSPHYFMKYVPFAPGKIVEAYVGGDVVRTDKLFQKLYKTVVNERQMLEAYTREQKLVKIILDIERQGVPVDLKRLRADVTMYRQAYLTVDDWLFKVLKIAKGEMINLNSTDQLIDALIRVKKIDEDALGVTETGKRKGDKESLEGAVTDKKILAILKYRAQLHTCLNTFLERWLKMAEASNGFIFTSWNQTKGSDKGGTRTGRMSSSPNFQNIPKTFEALWKHQAAKGMKKDLLASLVECPIKGLPDLPLVRSYVVPFPGHMLIDRDYSQQEPRILAHFEGGQLMGDYKENPWMDLHDSAKAKLEEFGLFYERKQVKNTNLGIIYGMGLGKLAMQNDMAVKEAKDLKVGILRLYPGLKEMYKEMTHRAENDQPIRTWGGREYYCEPPAIDKKTGRLKYFDYKMVNLLIQGSAGDCTKQAMINYYEKKPKHHKLLLTVHDQMLASIPVKELEDGMEILRTSMESVGFEVAILSEGATSKTNWANEKDYDKKGKRV